MMKQLRLDYPTSVLSRMLVVSASGYYAWVDRPPSKRAREEVRLELEIKAAHKRTRQTYGPERLQRDLAEHGVRVGIGRIKRIRKKLGIRCKQKRRFKATTLSRHSQGGNDRHSVQVLAVIRVQAERRRRRLQISWRYLHCDWIRLAPVRPPKFMEVDVVNGP